MSINWNEYDSAAMWCAKRGYLLRDGEPLPPLLSSDVMKEISEYPDSFISRIKLFSYANAMELISKKNG